MGTPKPLDSPIELMVRIKTLEMRVLELFGGDRLRASAVAPQFQRVYQGLEEVNLNWGRLAKLVGRADEQLKDLRAQLGHASAATNNMRGVLGGLVHAQGDRITFPASAVDEVAGWALECKGLEDGMVEVRLERPPSEEKTQ